MRSAPGRDIQKRRVSTHMDLSVSLLDGEGELLNVRLWLVLDHLVDKGQDVVALHAE